MKKFIVINGSELFFLEAETMQNAITWCQNYCNHSEEVIVREYTAILADFNHPYKA